MSFWIAAIGRSGTTWLARTLNNSPTWRVRHEGADKHHALAPLYYSPFPIARFEQHRYGECHGKLLRYLSPEFAGPERLVARRAVLLRDPKAIVKSWMRVGVERVDLAWIVKRVLDLERWLVEYARSDEGCQIVTLERLTTDLDYLRDFVSWLGIDDFKPTEIDQARRINVKSRPRWNWTDADESIWYELSNRYRSG